MSQWQARLVDWAVYQQPLGELRRAVFIEEQSVPPELEWDGLDPDCLHALVEDDSGRAIGCGRLCHGEHIGRMAVASGHRHQGVGSALLRCLIEAASARGACEVHLNAQLDALPFYQVHGFQAEGEIFDDAGIPHRRMRLAL